ncbi:rhodanese-like domain-containing protein [Kerstersia sp.]|uniref:rhodanese-like domain-containing protein n=1 Tax=Kerstersia sp. TaxID=1930783 RepID=UPI003F8E2639
MDFIYSPENLMLIAVVLLSGIMLAWPAIARSRLGTSLVPAAAVQYINHKNALVIDVRTSEAFQKGHIAQARHIAASDIEQKADALPKNRPLLVVSETGRDTSRIITALKAKGHTEVANLDGGLRAWSQANMPLSSGKR